MERHMATISLEVPQNMKEEIQQAIRELHYHTNSELVRNGIRKVLDEIKVKQNRENTKL